MWLAYTKLPEADRGELFEKNNELFGKANIHEISNGQNRQPFS